MTGWTDPEPRPRPEKRGFLADFVSLGAASTPSREVLISGLLIGVVSLLVFVIRPDRFSGGFEWIILGIVVAYCIVRFAMGIPKWRRRR